MRDGRVYVPLRSVFEHLGASVVFANGTVNASGATHAIHVRVGSTRAFVDGRAVQLDAAPFLAGHRAYVPLRFVAQALGATVKYDDATRTVTILSPRTATPTPAPTASPPPPAPPSMTASPAPLPTAARSARPSANFITALRPFYEQRVEPAFVVEGRTHPRSSVRIDAVASGRSGGGPWTRQGSTGATVVADERGYFNATLSVPAFGAGIIDLHIVSVDPSGNSADVRTRARFGR